MRAWLSRSDFTSEMISSLSFLYLRSCAGDSEEFFRRNSMSCSCRRRRRLNEIRDGVEGLDHLRLQLGLDGGERKRILHIVFVVIALGSGLARILRRSSSPSVPGALNGVAAGGAAGGAGVCTT